MSWGVGLALLTLLSALLASTYVYQASGSPSPSDQRLVWQAAPAASPWPAANRWSYLDAQSHTADTLRIAEREQQWCEADDGAHFLRRQLEFTDDVDAVWENLRTPAQGDDLAAVRAIAAATAAARGMVLESMPQVWLVSRTELRRWGCLSELVLEIRAREEAQETEQRSRLGEPAERLTQLLGLRDPALTEAVRRQLRITLWGGWYSEPDGYYDQDATDGPGSIYLVTRAPIPMGKVATISHELLHALQDQLLDWKLHDAFLEPDTSDSLTARRWLIEGDASANELTHSSAALGELVEAHPWGPASGMELALARRASEAMSPHESAATFAPYEDGAAVVARLARAQGQPAVNALLHAPPASTEQLMHPEKLAAEEAPIALRDLDELRRSLLRATAWQEPIVDRMGEHWLRTLLVSATGDAARSDTAAAGWGGDQIALWQSIIDPEHAIVTMQFVFDDEREHREGIEGLLAWLVAHSDGEARTAVDQPIVGWDSAAGSIRLITRSESIWLIATRERSSADQLALGIVRLRLTDYWDA